MRNVLTTSVQRLYRTWAQAALVSSALLALGNTPANAQILYRGDYQVSDISTNNNWVLVKTSSWVQATTGLLTVRWDAWKPGPYNCAVHIVVYDSYWNVAFQYEHQGTPNNETFYSKCFNVNPNECYIVYMYITDPQNQPRWTFYNFYFELLNGNYPWAWGI